MKKTRLLTTAAALAVVLASTAAQADVAVLKAASFLPEKASFGWPFFRWVGEVNKTCAGKVRIEVLAPGAVNAFEQPNALKTGVIDVMSGPPTYYKGTLPEADAMVLSEITADGMRANGALAYLNGLHNAKLNAELLTYFGDGVPFHVYSRQALRNGRFDGMSIRSAPIYDTLLQERGAKTVTMPPPAIYSALERGTVDGYAWPIWGIADFGWHKHTKFRVEPGYFNVVVNLLVNLDRWKALDDAQRGCLTDMAVALEKAWPAWRDEYTAKELATQEAAGIQVVDLGAEFRKRAHDLYWAELENTSPENIRKLKGLLLK